MNLTKNGFFYALFTLFLLGVMPSCDDDDDDLNDEVGFDAFDLDNDNMLDQDEFRAAYEDYNYFENWDTDDDDDLDETEWQSGLDTYVPDYDATQDGIYTDWDLDNDGVLDNTELEDNVFDIYDEDDDDFLDEVEFDEWFEDFNI
jgi:hypothetical protein